MLETAFSRLTADAFLAKDARRHLEMQMAPPPRAYHTIAHVEAVLRTLFDWTNGQPSVPLLAAALYHDAIYDPTRHDNEEQSAVFCRQELAALGVAAADTERACSLILETQTHQPPVNDAEAILLVDADLYILGSDEETYTRYVAAIRQEYAHVPDADWRVGRAAVLRHFLERERLYHGEWPGREAREAQARVNIAREIAELENPRVL